MSHDVPNPDLADLVRRAGHAADAIINGEMRRYADLIPHTDDFTLFAPFGGELRHGFDDSDDALAAAAEFFQGGEARLDLVQAHTSGDLAVLVVVEREHGRIGGLPDQDLSLRVTMVFRREDGEWKIVHRHADPITEARSIGSLAQPSGQPS